MVSSSTQTPLLRKLGTLSKHCLPQKNDSQIARSFPTLSIRDKIRPNGLFANEAHAISKGEQTRDRILREAAIIFNERGYEGCSLKEIMAATGLEKGGIYRHFANKEELAAEAFDYAWRTASSRRRHGLSQIENHADRLHKYVANFLEAPGFPGGCPLLNTAVDSDNGNPILRQRVRAALADWQAYIVSILESGIHAGTIRPAIDPRTVANRIIGSLEGAMLLSRIEGRREPLHAGLRELDNFIEAQLRAPAI